MIRLPTIFDADEIFALVEKNRERLREWLPWLDCSKSVEDSRHFINESLLGHTKGTRFDTVIIHEERIIGFVGFNTLNVSNRSGTIGYWIDKDSSGKGLLTQALKELLDQAFSKMNLHRVEIHAAIGNTRSCAVAQRLGFTLEGTIRDAEWLYDKWVSHNVYGLLSNEWKKHNH